MKGKTDYKYFFSDSVDTPDYAESNFYGDWNKENEIETYHYFPKIEEKQTNKRKYISQPVCK